MGVYSSVTQRPPNFELNPYSPLATGLVFAGLGRITGSTHYRDSSPYGRHGTLTNIPASGWKFLLAINRYSYTCAAISTLYDKITLPDITLDAPWSVSWWSSGPGMIAGTTSVSTYDFLFLRDGSYIRFFANGTKLADFSSVSSFATLAHYSITVSSAKTRLYKNGTFLEESAVSSSFLVNGWGMAYSDIGLAHVGELSDTMLHRRVISDGEIQQFADPSNVMLSGLILPPRRRLWAVSGGAAPATTRRNLVLGGGVL